MAPVTRTLNYFNFYTEIEEYFWKKRGASILVSPLDWAILESWQQAAIPLPVVLKGIDRAFESYARSKRGASGRPLKSLAYCVDAVLEEAAAARQAAAGTGPVTEPARTAEEVPPDQVQRFLEGNRTKLAASEARWQTLLPALAARAALPRRALEALGAELAAAETPDLQDLERRLTVLEDRLFAALQEHAAEETQLAIRRELDRALAPYRRKLSAEQLALVERQFLRKRLFEEHGLPRLSLFYMT